MDIQKKILECIEDKKGQDVVILDVSNFSSITDTVIIASGLIDRHVIAMGAAIHKEMKQQGVTCLHADGLRSGDWVLLDYGTIIVHLFHPDVRTKYRLEELYSS